MNLLILTSARDESARPCKCWLCVGVQVLLAFAREVVRALLPTIYSSLNKEANNTLLNSWGSIPMLPK